MNLILSTMMACVHVVMGEDDEASLEARDFFGWEMAQDQDEIVLASRAWFAEQLISSPYMLAETLDSYVAADFHDHGLWPVVKEWFSFDVREAVA